MQYYYTKNIIVAGLLVFLLFFIFTSACAKKESDYCIVTEVNDGDTLTIVTNSVLGIFVRTEKVRLIGIDAPELAQEPWGRKAKNYLKKLVKESDMRVKIELDVQHRDKYGRILAYLWDKNGNMINYMMIRNGYAMVYTIPPNVKYVELFVEAQRLARQEKKGIWGKDGLTEKPSDWRKQHPRN
ncbi:MULTISPECIES: thermonuclease family protein [Thermodesulfovibrio]|jgi:micrococcal nuclease|uniref:Thermonuclease n=1 Tax=Thermodesulfovibrio yellowstonii (strain ATCC 51303 / DSM 11347 / YP87) TaxID=289376 RepID=B5YHI2_THEYD|nr:MULTISPECIES: thermonuclease family protein [Thermodesulfovibrio]ACI21182.1 thermonuclease [Thermodesulfovibrio yellowstonii DSM 11347]MDI6865254.1 thermonuclease family protein [Thermodesulfovibrio yellowstonii]